MLTKVGWKKEAEALGKSSFAFAFYMDRQKDERERGVTIACTTKEFFTETKLSKIHWKIGKATGGKKLEDAPFIKANEMAELTFTPLQPFVVDTFKSCEGLGRIAIMEGNSVVMLGKVITI